MRKGMTYIEVIISITIATICFIPLLSMLYISVYNDKLAKNIHYANLLSKNMIVEIENNLQNKQLSYLNFEQLTLNNNFDDEYMTQTFEYYVHIQKNKNETFEFKTNNDLTAEIKNDLNSTNDIFNTNYYENYDIIIANDISLEILKGEHYTTVTDEILINNEQDFMKICILNKNEETITINSTTNNNIQIHIVGEHLNVISNVTGNIIYTDDIYRNDYYVVSVFVYEENELIASNSKVISR